MFRLTRKITVKTISNLSARSMKAGDYGDAWNWTCASPPKAPRPWCPRLSFALDSLLPPPPFNVAFFPNTQNKPALPLLPPPPPTQFTVSSFPLLLGASLPFLLPGLAKPQPTPTPRLPHLFSASLILRSWLQKTRSLNFFLHWISLSEIFPPTVDKLRQIRTNSQKCERSRSSRETRRWRTPVRVRPGRRPRVFTRPHPAVTERGNFLFLGIFGVFAAVFFSRDCLPRAGDQTICLHPAK
jgi:hypothetical protein